MDKKLNVSGNKILDLCRYNDMLIVDGRIDWDKTEGKFTIWNTNVIDFFICTILFVKYIFHFEV